MSQTDYKQYLLKSSSSVPAKGSKFKSPDPGARSSVASVTYYDRNPESFNSQEIDEELLTLD